MRTITLVTILLLAGCAVPRASEWQKPGAVDVDARAALARCRTLASKQPLSPKVGAMPDANNSDATGLGESGMSVADMGDFNRAVIDCMAADGWSRR